MLQKVEFVSNGESLWQNSRMNVKVNIFFMTPRMIKCHLIYLDMFWDIARHKAEP